jgi:hypothetical protein
MAGIRVHTQTDKDIRDTDTVTKDTEIEYRQTCWQMTQQYGTKQELYEKTKNKKNSSIEFLNLFLFVRVILKFVWTQQKSLLKIIPEEPKNQRRVNCFQVHFNSFYNVNMGSFYLTLRAMGSSSVRHKKFTWTQCGSTIICCKEATYEL